MNRSRRVALLLVPALAALSLAAASLAPPPAAQLEGVVTVASTGRPAAGANVSLVGTALGAPSGPDGRFQISGAAAGTVDVRVTLVGYAPHVERGVVLRDGETTRLDVRLGVGEVEVVVAGERGAAPSDIRFRTDGVAPPMSPPPPGAPPVTGAPGRGVAGAVTTEGSGDLRIRGGRSEESAGDYVDGVRVESSASDAAGERTAEDDGERRSRPAPQPRAGLLTAGDIDDGLNWPAFLGYSARAVQQGSVLRDLRLDDRITLRVVDRDGRPVAGARVRIDAADGGRRRGGLTTEAGTDGRLALFPRYDFGMSAGRLTVSVTPPGGQGAAETVTLDLRGQRRDAEQTVRLRVRAARPEALDLAIVLDVTGSMGDEHRYLTDEFENIVAQARRRHPDADLRFALVAYRDRGDDFVVRSWDFTRSEREMRGRLEQLSAGGGGDWPEAMDEAFDAMLNLDWRTGTAARIAFVVADAPPHAGRLTETLDAVREARARGLRMYPIAASGVDASAEHVLRTAAALTQGRYLWLTDDSGVGNSHAEPTVACYDVQTVDRLVARVIESELSGRRVEADPQDVVRSVGNPVGGVCEPDAVSQQQRSRRRGTLGYD